MLQMFDVLALLRIGGILVPPRTNMTIPHFFLLHIQAFMYEKARKSKIQAVLKLLSYVYNTCVGKKRENAKSEN